MRRFRLAVLGASGLLTLLICLAWHRSDSTCDEFAWAQSGRRYLTLQSLEGRVTFATAPAPPFDQPLAWVAFPSDRAKFIPFFHPRPGQKAWTAPLRHRETGELVRLSDHDVLKSGYRIPYWLLALAAALPALALIARHLGIHRASARARRAGRCPHCGYDLRATPTRCPECGNPTAPTVPISPSPLRERAG